MANCAGAIRETAKNKPEFANDGGFFGKSKSNRHLMKRSDTGF